MKHLSPQTTVLPLLVCFILGIIILATPASANDFKVNYDEAKVPEYTLPDPLVTADGKKVTDTTTWEKKRREEILELFREHMYGRSPGRPDRMSYTVTSVNPKALGGKATQKQVTIHLGQGKKALDLDVLIYLPNHVKRPVPVLLGMNFFGNHTTSDDPAITLSTSTWFRNDKQKGFFNHRASEKTRGTSTSRWPIELAIDRGFGVATLYYGDLDPDDDDGFKNGVHGLFTPDNTKETKRPGDAWGAVAAWAWGLSRVMDYFETDDAIDHHHVAVFGHSRLGKTSLWAGAQDPRFALVISNDSGCGGAALNRRLIGETLAKMNKTFPHWLCENCKEYDCKESALPVDQHMLITLVAPRPVYVASATGDRWADPRGEFLAAKNAEPVYRLYGKQGLTVERMPAPNTSVGESIGYHIRTGKHDITVFDWTQYLNFAEKHFGIQ